MQVGPTSYEQNPPPLRVYDLPATGPARLIGRANALIPGAYGVCWLQTFPRSGHGPSSLVASGADGQRHFRRLSVPYADDVVAAAPGTVLAASTAPLPDDPNAMAQPVPIKLRNDDGTTRTLDRAGSSVLAVHNALIAWSRPDGSIRTENVETGGPVRQYKVRADPLTVPPADIGAFSPDDRQLAVAVPGLPTGIRAGNLASYGYIEVIDLATGDIRRVSGVKIPAKTPPALGWLDPHTLLMELQFGHGIRLAGWDSQRNRTYAIGSQPIGVADPPVARFATLPAT